MSKESQALTARYRVRLSQIERELSVLYGERLGLLQAVDGGVHAFVQGPDQFCNKCRREEGHPAHALPARPSGRPPLWPDPWIALADACGGSSVLRTHLGLKSKTSLSGRIAGTIPWTRDDVLSLAGLCRVHGMSLSQLLDPNIVCSILVLGLGSYPAPGVRP